MWKLPVILVVIKLYTRIDIFKKEKTWKRNFNTDYELSQNRTKNKFCHSKQQQTGYLVIYDIIESLVVLIEKLSFFNNELWGFIISWSKNLNSPCLLEIFLFLSVELSINIVSFIGRGILCASEIFAIVLPNEKKKKNK